MTGEALVDVVEIDGVRAGVVVGVSTVIGLRRSRSEGRRTWLGLDDFFSIDDGETGLLEDLLREVVNVVELLGVVSVFQPPRIGARWIISSGSDRVGEGISAAKKKGARSEPFE